MPDLFRRVRQLLGSLLMAVVLLLAIGGVLAWGTIYEARFGTAAVQRAVYQSWWFQALLAFLAVNLAIAALERYPWQRKHIPFVLAHIGIIVILFGGIIGARFGIEGQLVIPEGQAERALELPAKLLSVDEPNPGVRHLFPMNFEAAAWIHEPQRRVQVPLKDRSVELLVDRYYPNAVIEERVSGEGHADNPALHIVVRQGEQQGEAWLFAKDADRAGARIGPLHLLFLQVTSEHHMAQWLNDSAPADHQRGVLSVTLPELGRVMDIPVPEVFTASLPIPGTPYAVVFKDYFPDFALTAQGPISRSMQPSNPAISFILSGPEGADPYLLFARYPEFQAVHGIAHTIHAQVQYTHPNPPPLPPQAMVFLRAPAGELSAILTGPERQRQRLASVAAGERYVHPWAGDEIELTHYYPRATFTQEVRNRDNDVRAEALHIVGRDGAQTAEGWVTAGAPLELPLGGEPIRVEFRHAQRELPFTVKLLDFRKIDYPGTQMAAGFESDVELTDPQRGLLLMRTISMNKPLRYRGFSVFQSSYIDGPTQTTVLSVRSDPGTPLVYAGFLIVIAGVVSLFVFGAPRSSSA